MNRWKMRRIAKRQTFLMVRPGDSIIVAMPGIHTQEEANNALHMFEKAMPAVFVTVAAGVNQHIVYRPWDTR